MTRVLAHIPFRSDHGASNRGTSPGAGATDKGWFRADEPRFSIGRIQYCKKGHQAMAPVATPKLTAIALAQTDGEIRGCHPVMAQLRPHVSLEGFVARIRQMQTEGFRLAFLTADGEVRAVAGYRVLDQLVSGRVLYVDDLVTDETTRSAGHGAALLAWLQEHARTQECEHLELDSGVHRAGAHRFYFRHGLSIVAYHFRSGPLQSHAMPSGSPGRESDMPLSEQS